MILLVAFTNFEPNLMLVDINKLKSYKFIEFEVQDLKYIHWSTRKNHRQQINHKHESKMILI
jgi:hypothetical protein